MAGFLIFGLARHKTDNTNKKGIKESEIRKRKSKSRSWEGRKAEVKLVPSCAPECTRFVSRMEDVHDSIVFVS